MNIELTKKGGAYAARDAIAMVPVINEEAGFVFVTCKANHRLSIGATIERLIDMLDAMDDDPDLEPYLAGGGMCDDREGEHGIVFNGDADSEGWLGWPEHEPEAIGREMEAIGFHDRELDTADDEPLLGWPNAGQRITEEMARADDRECDSSDYEANGDDELTLGAPECHPSPYGGYAPYGEFARSPIGGQAEWAKGSTRAAADECEETCEDEGADIQSQPHDDDAGSSGIDAEPELGWPEQIDQEARLIETDEWKAEDGEPDLGFVGHGTGWREGEAVDDREGDDEREGRTCALE